MGNDMRKREILIFFIMASITFFIIGWLIDGLITINFFGLDLERYLILLFIPPMLLIFRQFKVLKTTMSILLSGALFGLSISDLPDLINNLARLNFLQILQISLLLIFYIVTLIYTEFAIRNIKVVVKRN